MPRTRRVDVFVPAPPEAVEQSLRAQTRRALLPGLTDVWGDGRQPLKGRVENATFTLAPNERVFFARIHSTARGELTASGEGTRVTARVGISPALVWMYRISTIAFGLMLVGLAARVVWQGDPPSIVLVWLALWGLAIVAGVGWSVGRADREINGLAAQLESAVMEAAPLTAELQAEEPQAEEPQGAAQRLAAQQSSRLMD